MLKELNDGTSYIKATYWKGEDLEGIWLATYKIFKNWNTSLSILSTEEETIPITQDMFSLKIGIHL